MVNKSYRYFPRLEQRLSHDVKAEPKCWIKLGTHEVEIHSGETVLGRHDSCQIVLDDPLASRRHARLEFSAGRLVVEDLGSVNGVLVNGARADGRRILTDGDVLRLGNQDLSVHLSEATRGERRSRHGAETLTKARPAAPTVPPSSEDESTMIRDGEALETLVSVANKILAMGRGVEAERLLRHALGEVLQRVQSGRPVDDAVLDTAATYALRLAGALRKAEWISYAFELFGACDRVLPAPAIEKLYEVVRIVPGLELDLMRDYVSRIQRRAHSLTASESFQLRRLEGVTKLASL